LEQHHTELNNAGLQVVAVAMGEPKHIARYCTKLAPSITCLTGGDTSKEAYHAYGLTQGRFKELVSADVLKAGFRAFSQGKFGGKVTADPLMMPGFFLIDEDGRIMWTYYAKHVGDHPTIEVILEQVKD
jgi:peroxiredoxin